MVSSSSPSSLSGRKRSSACRVLFPEAAKASAPPSPISDEMRLRPQLMPRGKRPAESPAAAAAPAAPAAATSTGPSQVLQPVAEPTPSTSQQPLQQLQQPQQEAPPTLQPQPEPLPSFATSFTSLLYNPAPAFAWAPAAFAQPLYVHTDYSYFPVPYFPAAASGGYAPVLCIDAYPPAPVAASCFYTPEPYGQPAAKRPCF